MAIIKTPVVGVSPYDTTATAPIVLRADANGNTVLANPPVAAAAAAADIAATNANSNVYVTGQEALNRLITTNSSGVFAGANVTINLEEQNFTTTNQVTSNTNYPSGNIGEIQFNSGSNSFASNAYFTYADSNIITPGIRTDGYFYANGTPFTSGGNAAIGNFVFTGDTMSIAHVNSALNIKGNSTGNNENYIIINPTSVDIYAFNTSPYSYAELYLENSNTETPYAQIIVDGNSTPQQTWTFDHNGNLTAPGNISAINLIINSIRSDDSSFVTIEDGLNVTSGLISAPGSMSLTAGANTWTLYANGTTQFPANVIQAPAGSPITVRTTNGNTYSRLAAGDTFAQIGLQNDTTGAYQAWAYVETDMANVNTPSAVIILKPGDTGTEVRWNFDATGDMTAPGNISAVNLVINSIRSDDSTFVTIEDGLNVNGEISATGNITGNYFIGNGSQLTGIIANTGNVTFRDEIVIGTGTSNLISGLYLAPSSSSANANMYLRVRGNINDEPTHIHFDTGNNAYYNQFIGDDNKYIQLANTGNIIINSNDGVGNSAQWTFGSAGKIILPQGASLNDTSGDSVAFGYRAGTSQAQHAVAIGAYAGNLYQGEDSIAIGYQAGYHDQQRGVAIGYQAGVGGTLYRSVSDAQSGSGPVTTYSP